MSESIWIPNQDIQPAQLKAALDAGKKPFLLDVRETSERGISCLPDDAHVPLGDLGKRIGELDTDAEIVIYCRTGNRSGIAADTLRRNGFTNVHNLLGGINAWAEQVDPTKTKY